MRDTKRVFIHLQSGVTYYGDLIRETRSMVDIMTVPDGVSVSMRKPTILAMHDVTGIDIDAVFDGYVEAALWSSHDTTEQGEEHGDMLDANYSAADIEEATLRKMREDCEQFVGFNGEDIIAYCEQRPASSAYDDSQGPVEAYLGHDFWLTRNGHGAGFWDRGLGKLGDRLSEAASTYGTYDLYVGDDNKIHGT